MKLPFYFVFLVFLMVVIVVQCSIKQKRENRSNQVCRCPNQYLPVCSGRKNFRNNCFALCSGFTNATVEQCKSKPPTYSTNPTQQAKVVPPSNADDNEVVDEDEEADDLFSQPGQSRPVTPSRSPKATRPPLSKHKGGSSY
eukprot:TRINITY_DN6306_c0_g1_i1.p1 TRINITY_DN6306_c0_g1~~TRINITY_DN6306_c0_g1_i1.p1  ORF type:complete len:141 (-),score=21.61 TRINITY_DN6306_c0_g1_i1:93-515(-)